MISFKTIIKSSKKKFREIEDVTSMKKLKESKSSRKTERYSTENGRP